MPFISSPVAYPASSSPAASPLKRKRTAAQFRNPLNAADGNARPEKGSGLFQEDSEDEDHARDDSGVELTNVKRARETVKGSALTTNPVNPPVHLRFGASILGQVTTSGNTEPNAAPRTTLADQQNLSVSLQTTAGDSQTITRRKVTVNRSYEQIVASRSEVMTGKAQRGYYGIQINTLLNDARAELAARCQKTDAPKIVAATTSTSHNANGQASHNILWTEKYRARKFTDLVGDDRTHRTVMHWLKSWDPVVFPGASRKTTKSKSYRQDDVEQKSHRKVLLLTGPPGLGKTTLAHVCAKQAGYEVAEINGSDDRSKDTVKGKIRDILGTENVKSASVSTNASGIKKVAKPMCLIVDEVDGVTGSSGGGEGGFVKALIDLLLLDQRNGANVASSAGHSTGPRKKKGDSFRMMRPLVMVCNDAYNNALRPLRTSGLVEIVHVGRPALNTVANRVQGIFEREGIASDGDAVRKLCEGCWGVTSRKEGGSGVGAGEGDIRSVLVLAEWISRRLRSEQDKTTAEAPRLTKKWLEEHLAKSSGGETFRGLGRGGSKEIVDRVFTENAGLSRQQTSSGNLKLPSTASNTKKTVKSVNEALKAASSSHIRTLVDGHGESDRIVTDLFTQYPSQPYQDDTFLSKPSHAYEWLNFHDRVSSAVFSSSEWELAPYLSTPVVGFHHLFASSSAIHARHAASNPIHKATFGAEADGDAAETHPFQGAQSSFAATQRQKEHTAFLQTLHDSLSLPLTRLFPRPESMSTELTPFLLRCVAPNVNPVLITSSSSSNSSSANNKSSGSKFDNNKTSASVRKASEKVLIDRAVRAMIATGTRFERHRVENGPQSGPKQTLGAGAAAAGFVYRMQPALDEYGVYETLGKGRANDVGGGVSASGGRYGVRQVLVQECAGEVRRREGEARARRRRGGRDGEDDDEQPRDERDGAEGEKEEDGKEGAAGAKKGAKRDFFGRVIADHGASGGITDGGKTTAKSDSRRDPRAGRIWVTFHEGYSNAVRKPVTIAELMRNL